MVGVEHICFYCLRGHPTAEHADARQFASSVQWGVEDLKGEIERLGHSSLHEIEGFRRSFEEMGVHVLVALDEAVDAIAAETHAAADRVVDALEWTHAQAMWARERQIQLLTGIHDMAKNPRATQANELFRMGTDSLGRRRLDDAARLLRDATGLNPGDYRVHMALGHVLVEQSETRAALAAFEAARDYARTDDYRTAALRRVARALVQLGEPARALEVISEAAQISPRDTATLYEKGLYAALAAPRGTSAPDESILSDLRHAIQLDRNMFVRIEIEPAFDTIRGTVTALLASVQANARDEALESLRAQKNFVAALLAWEIPGADELERAIGEAEALLEQGGYFSYLDATALLRALARDAEQYLESACEEFAHGVAELRSYRRIGSDVDLSARLQELRGTASDILRRLESHPFQQACQDTELLMATAAQHEAVGDRSTFTATRADLRRVAPALNEIRAEVRRIEAAMERRRRWRALFWPRLGYTVKLLLGFGLGGALVGALLGGVVGASMAAGANGDAGAGWDAGAGLGILAAWAIGVVWIGWVWLKFGADGD